MTVKAVDASAIAAMVFQEPEATDIVVRLAGHDLAAPRILRFELANVCLKKLRRHGAVEADILQQHDLALAMNIAEYGVDYRECIALAERFKLSAYDASYLWLAQRLNVELVTLDERLDKAARAI